MLLLEDKYVKIFSAALALLIGLVTVVMAMAAFDIPDGITQGLGQEEATAALQNEGIEGIDDTSRADEKSFQEAPLPESADASGQSQVEEAAAPNPNTNMDTGNVYASSVSEGDIWLLAQVIHAEGRGESLQGQIAIGAVLLNRVRDSRFPNSLAGVVYEPGAFCTVADGQIYLTPDARALEAARQAANGYDPTGGALYFYNPARTTSRWIYTRPVLGQIGRHVFAA
ncbi:MAG: hypothetical protein GX316_04610 [Firmicutes bacterium]|nr:hypothetical protein [Bacillota bacterium]